MEIFFHEISVSTRQRIEIVDITRQVEEAVTKSGVKNGLCLIHAPHATAAIVANENEYGLINDIVRKVEEVFPIGAGYQHDRIDDNAHAHLASAFIGSSRIFPVKNSRILRGTWQNVFLVEADGPRNRRVVVEVLGE
ncbi:MAG: YjbQ family protein [Candidatus Hecatellales archaeon]|nr:MAG: YjbQ family protein [Candidatus Hecatellales archaeon]